MAKNPPEPVAKLAPVTTTMLPLRVVIPGLDIHTALGTVTSEYGDLLLLHPEMGLVLWQPLRNE